MKVVILTIISSLIWGCSSTDKRAAPFLFKETKCGILTRTWEKGLFWEDIDEIYSRNSNICKNIDITRPCIKNIHKVGRSFYYVKCTKGLD